MVKGRTRGLVALLCSGLLLGGCSGGNLAFGVTPEQTEGTWFAGGEFDTELTLLADATLEAREWPAHLRCSDLSAMNVGGLVDDERRDFAGTWSPGEGELKQHIMLLFDNKVCPQGGTFADLWRAGNGKLQMCITVPRGLDPDELQRDQIFVLSKDAADAGAAASGCF